MNDGSTGDLANRKAMDEAVRSTIEHALRLNEKARMLDEQVRDAIAVAASLAGRAGERISWELYEELHIRLRAAEVVGRSVFSRSLSLEQARGIWIAENLSPGARITLVRGDTLRVPYSGHVVYLLLNQDRDVIYIGTSRQARRRLKEHASKPWRYAEIILCSSRAAAYQLEADLIFHHQPDLNVAGRESRGFVA